MPMISVIVPVYKVEPYIHRCIDSILSQTFSDLELILVDDGSPDHCGAICDEYAAKDSRIVVIHQENGGPSAARNAGIDWAFANSDSQWLTFIDSDDWVHPQYLECLYSGIAESDAMICIGNYLNVDGPVPIDPINCTNILLISAESTYCSRYNMAMTATGKLFARSLFNNMHFPKGKLNEDAFITYRILFSAQKIAVTDVILYYYFRNQNGIMRSPWTPQKLDEIEALEEHISFFKNLALDTCTKQANYAYIRRLYAQLIAIEKSTWNKSSYLKILRRKLKSQLLHFPELCTFAENKGIYEKAFPSVMWCYWTFHGIVGRFTRGNKKCQ